MSEMSFEQMLEESLKTIRNGEVVEGTVIDVKPEEIILNIGYKSDGILPKAEYTNDSTINLTEAVKVGDKLDVKIVKVNDGDGQVALTHKRLVADRGSKRIEEAFNKAYEADPQSIFGGIVAVNYKVDAATATEMNKIFLEIVAAPDYDEDALDVLKQKKI